MDTILFKQLTKISIIIISVYFSTNVFSQESFKSGEIHGNFQTDIQYYNTDSVIGAPDVPEKMLMNSFANILYTKNKFSAGIRYESYQNPMLGFDSRYKGSGIPFRFATYTHKDFEITIGNFYEQFGSGMIFRSYEERNLGIDNAMDGIRLKYTPYKGITIKGLVGNQRLYFQKGKGIVRAADAEFFLNDIFKSLDGKKTKYLIGGSVVSKYEKDQDPIYKLPENVAAGAGRFNISRSKVLKGNINISGEYAYKVNDPSAINNKIYRPGNAMFGSIAYSKKGLGIILSGKRIDNMNFRSERNAINNDLSINYLPALTKQHTYSLPAMYPYATQPNGENGFQVEVIKKFKKKTSLGGKYGTSVAINYSKANDLKKTDLPDSTHLGYDSDFLYTGFGATTYFRDINIEVSKKFSKKVKAIFTLMNIRYNIEIIEGHPGEEMVDVFSGIADITYKLNSTNSIRTELQYLQTKQDEGDWLLALLEYNIAPSWFFSVYDQYNIGNEHEKIHYYSAAFGYNKNSSRFSLSYGRQREGIICVGGVCRQLPASNGFLLTVTSSF